MKTLELPPEKIREMRKKWGDMVLSGMSVDEVIARYSPEEVLSIYKPEDRLKGLSETEIEDYLSEIRKAGTEKEKNT